MASVSSDSDDEDWAFGTAVVASSAATVVAPAVPQQSVVPPAGDDWFQETTSESDDDAGFPEPVAAHGGGAEDRERVPGTPTLRPPDLGLSADVLSQANDPIDSTPNSPADPAPAAPPSDWDAAKTVAATLASEEPADVDLNGDDFGDGDDHHDGAAEFVSADLQSSVAVEELGDPPPAAAAAEDSSEPAPPPGEAGLVFDAENGGGEENDDDDSDGSDWGDFASPAPVVTAAPPEPQPAARWAGDLQPEAAPRILLEDDDEDDDEDWGDFTPAGPAAVAETHHSEEEEDWGFASAPPLAAPAVAAPLPSLETLRTSVERVFGVQLLPFDDLPPPPMEAPMPHRLPAPVGPLAPADTEPVRAKLLRELGLPDAAVVAQKAAAAVLPSPTTVSVSPPPPPPPQTPKPAATAARAATTQAVPPAPDFAADWDDDDDAEDSDEIVTTEQTGDTGVDRSTSSHETGDGDDDDDDDDDFGEFTTVVVAVQPAPPPQPLESPVYRQVEATLDALIAGLPDLSFLVQPP